MLGKADFAFAIASSAKERNWSEEMYQLAGKLRRQTDSQTGFAAVALALSIYHLFSLRINWRVYDMINPTISENIMRLYHCCTISHNCYHSIDAIRINSSKICCSLDLEVACSDDHHISLINHSSTDREIAVDAIDNNWSCSNSPPDYSYHLNFDITNFSVCDDRNYFDTKLHSYQIGVATNVDCQFDYHHGHY